MDDMIETMYDAPGIGLAAVQVGILKRVVVIDVSKKDEDKKPLFLVNPEITFKSKTTSIYEEGCLSIPNPIEYVIPKNAMNPIAMEKYLMFFPFGLPSFIAK